MTAMGSITPTRNHSTRPFRVIVVGGGVGGLALSHAFQKSGIDHVILEKGIVAPPWGASISLWAHGARILQQLDCLDALEEACLPLKYIVTRTKDGKAFIKNTFFDDMVERNGYNCTTFERTNFLKIIYDRLPDKSYVKQGKRVCNIVETKHGIRAEMTDGTVEEGDILLGCDGVHSTVRELMWKNANNVIPDYITAKEKKSLVTTYTALVGVAKTLPGLGIRDMTWIHNDKLSFLINTQPDQTHFFVHFKLPQQRTWPHTPKYTFEDAERAAASVADHPVAESLVSGTALRSGLGLCVNTDVAQVFGEIWKNRVRGVLISLEEGVFDHWYHGRTALIGDSVHKVTPNYALGANCALEGVAVMCNRLNKLHKSLLPGQHPNQEAISALFQSYEEARKPRMKVAFDMSYHLTRLQTCDGWINKVIMMYLIPILGFDSIADDLAAFCAGSPKFDFLPVKYDKPATVKWEDEKEEAVVEKGAQGLTIGDVSGYKADVWFGALVAALLSLVLSIWY